jgi:hypothetical protein
MDVPLGSQSTSELDRRAIAGWAAVEHGDIEEARSALSEVYAADPEHPALPLLAAGIRRTRPNGIAWRSAVLIVLIAAGVAYIVQMARTRPVPEAAFSTAANVDQTPEEPSSIAPSSNETASVGTSGQNAEPRRAAKEAASDTAHLPASDDDMIRQGIARFAAAYSNWTPLAFDSCNISRGDDAATVTCLARSSTQVSSETDSGGTWMFTCKKIDSAWKIVSIQPPSGSH